MGPIHVVGELGLVPLETAEFESYIPRDDRSFRAQSQG